MLTPALLATRPSTIALGTTSAAILRLFAMSRAEPAVTIIQIEAPVSPPENAAGAPGELKNRKSAATQERIATQAAPNSIQPPRPTNVLRPVSPTLFRVSLAVQARLGTATDRRTGPRYHQAVKGKPLTIRLPKDLYDRVAHSAASSNESINSFLIEGAVLRLREVEQRALYDAFTLLGGDRDEADVDFAAEAQSQVVGRDG